MKNKNVAKMLKVWNKEYKKGMFSYLILLLLKEKPMYGLEISQIISKITNSEISFEDSGIYHILKKLKSNKFVTIQWQTSSKGPKRKYYTITDLGIELIKEFTKIFVIPLNEVLLKLIGKNLPDVQTTRMNPNE